MKRLRTSADSWRFRRAVPGFLLILALLMSSGTVTAQNSQTTTNATALDGPVAVNLGSLPPPGDQGLSGAAPWLHPGGASQLAQEKAFAAQNSARANIQSPPTSISTVPAISAPQISIPAIDSLHSNCLGCYPPDGALAVGTTYVVGAVNTAFSIWDKSGHVVKSPTSLPALLSKGPGCRSDLFHAYADPFVEYDASANQFVVGMINYDILFNTRLCIAVTTNGDPTGRWAVYSLRVMLPLTLFDFPQAAVGPGALYVTGNVFQYGKNYLGTRVYAIQTDPMYQTLSSTAVYHDVAILNGGGDPVDTLIPAKGVTTPDVMYFTAPDNCDNCNLVRTWKWSSPFNGDLFTYQGAVTVQTYSQPPAATQQGGDPIETNDTRELASAWYNGTIFGVHTIGCDPGNGTVVACVQWYQVGSVDSTPTLVNQGIDGSNDQNRFFPTLAVDSAGNMALGYAFSSTADYAGIRYTGLVNGSSTLEPEQTLVAGQKAMWPTGKLGRYGDYGTEVIDPSDGCTVWHLEEYAQAYRLWGTWLGSFKFNNCGT